MANKFNRFLGDALAGFLNPKGNMADFQHAARLYVNDTFRLAPKVKFLYYAVFNINPNVLKGTGFQDLHRRELNYLVKKMDLPRFTLNSELLNQYNRKTTSYTKINYDPITLTFHDDNNGVTNSMWALYYGHYFQDRLNSLNPYEDIDPPAFKNNAYQNKQVFPFRYGLDGKSMVGDNPFFYSIQLITLTKQRFFSYMLCNPKITNWQHDTMDQTDGSGVVQNTMSLAYDSVIYNAGKVEYDNPRDFAVLHYDQQFSPIAGMEYVINTVDGVTSTIIPGLESIFGDLFSGNSFNNIGSYFTPITEPVNVYNTGNQAPYGYGNSILDNISSIFSPTSTSGFQNYSFGSIDPNTGAPVGAETGTYSQVLNAPVDSFYSTGASAASTSINQSFSGVTSPPMSTYSSNFISDAYGSSLPSNISGAAESNSFNGFASNTLSESSGSINSNYFYTNVASSSAQQELIGNNPLSGGEPPDAFA